MESTDALLLGRRHLRGLRRGLVAAQRRPYHGHLQRDAEVRRLPHAHRDDLERPAARGRRRRGGPRAQGAGRRQPAQVRHRVEFSKTLLEHKLVDEYHFWVFPVLADGDDAVRRAEAGITHLDLLGTTTFKSGIVVHKLAPKA